MHSEFDIAIVGMSCRLPGARNVDEFWRNLAGSVDSISRLPDEEILASGVPRSQLEKPNYVKAAPVLAEPDGFDAPFFGFSPMEARTMDPQHRILLELAHEALEDAGCDPGRYSGRIGVFTGAAMNTYFMHTGLNRQLAEDYIPTLILNDKDFLSTRISHKLNLKGPSITIQTACSTSLVAIHLARQSLLSEETDMALAGAISVRVPHRAGYLYDAGSVVSPDGQVRAFDANANGTVFGSGGGIVVLKRLADAIAAGDSIHAIIKGSAVNNDGQEKAGYTAPSVNGQAEAVIEALSNAGVDADSISYVEAHGSGTPVGDPIEVQALSKAFRTFTERLTYCAIGSVKTNVGHLDAAAGIAGLIKTVLALKHREIPASLHYSEPNPEIDFPATPFYVNSQLAPWISDGPRRAGVMATGMGGTNAHVVLEEWPSVDKTTGDAASFNLLVLSARTETALDSATIALRNHLQNNANVDMADVAFTLQTGRKAFPHRRFLVCTGREDAVARLDDAAKTAAFVQGDQSTRPLILLLPGVGDHYVGMAHDLYEHFTVFRNEVDRCAKIISDYAGIDVREVLFPKNFEWKTKQSQRLGIDLKKMLAGTRETENGDSKKLNQTIYVQPALFTVEYALARLWNDFGIVPNAIVGHSMGEYVAACLAGVFSLEDALRLIVRRTQLVDRLPPGRMLAVNLPENEVVPLLNHDLSISLINGPSLCVVAGPVAAIDDFEKALIAKGIIYRPVQNTHAFHSRMLDPIVDEFESEVRKVQRHEPAIPFTSNVTGTWLSSQDAMDPAYWARHTNCTARFSDAVGSVWKNTDAILLEAGPGRTLSVLALQHPDRVNAGNPLTFQSLRHHYEDGNDVELLLQSVGKLWSNGVEINWENLYQGNPRRKVSLPTYPFDRKSYWISESIEKIPPASSELLGIDEWFYSPSWERVPFLSTRAVPNDSVWVIFTDRWGGGTGFCKRLQGAGNTVEMGQFGDLRAYIQLFERLKREAPRSINIVHLGCLTSDDDSTKDKGSRDSQNFGFGSLLYIAQAIGELDVSVPIRIGIVSNRMHEVTGEETLDPSMATVLGPCGVIPRELPNVECFNIDLPDPETADNLSERVIDRILSEFTASKCGDVIAYRGKYRWKRKYDHIQLPAPTVPKRLRDGGVYLITGGAGGLGLAVARYLARTCRARMVLTRRTPFPSKSEWKGLLASNNAPESVLRTVRELLEIEKMGAVVEVFAADAADREQMQRVIDETLKNFKSIDGVIHAAGVVNAGLIQAKTNDMIDSILAPKVQGTWILHDLLKDLPLDFLVLFSSMTSVITPFAQSDYSGANAFVDAFAHYSNAQRKFHTLAINWPGWKETGLLAELKTLPGTEWWKEAALEKAILTRDGIEAFSRALDSDFQQIVVSPENLEDLIYRSRDESADWQRRAIAHESLAVETEETADQIETILMKIWKSAFGLDRIGLHDDFLKLGGHSLLAMKVVADVRSSFQIEFTLRSFFDATTIAQQGAVIRDEIIRKIESMSTGNLGIDGE